MRRPPAQPASTSPAEERRSPEIEARKQEIIKSLESGSVELKPFYWDLRNRIVRPWETIQTSRYFWFRWSPVLGPTYTVIVINLRLLCAERSSERGGFDTSDEHDKLAVSHTELAELTGINVHSIKRMLATRTFRSPENWFLSQFMKPYQRYEYDPKKGKKVRAPNGYQVAMDDPLLPEDEEALRGLYAEEEIQNLIKEGVVDLKKYAELRSSHPPSAQIAHQVISPNAQFAHQVQPSAHQVQPSKITREIQHPPHHASNAQIINCALGQPPAHQVQQTNIIQQSPSAQASPSSSSSSSRSLATATTYDNRTLGGSPCATQEELTKTITETFDGHISFQKAKQLIELHGLEQICNQLNYFEYRDNSWANKGPAAAFITYCRDEKPAPEAYVEMLLSEERAQQEEGAWLAIPMEERLCSLLSQWETHYASLPVPRGETNEPQPEEVDDATQGLLLGLQQGMGKQDLFTIVDAMITATGTVRQEAAKRYEEELGQVLDSYRKGLSEAEAAKLTEEAKGRALERGGDFVKRHMPKPLLEAIEYEIMNERARERFPSWSEYWRRITRTMG